MKLFLLLFQSNRIFLTKDSKKFNRFIRILSILFTLSKLLKILNKLILSILIKIRF
jgi:hypothetical protein